MKLQQKGERGRCSLRSTPERWSHRNQSSLALRRFSPFLIESWSFCGKLPIKISNLLSDNWKRLGEGVGLLDAWSDQHLRSSWSQLPQRVSRLLYVWRTSYWSIGISDYSRSRRSHQKSRFSRKWRSGRHLRSDKLFFELTDKYNWRTLKSFIRY